MPGPSPATALLGDPPATCHLSATDRMPAADVGFLGRGLRDSVIASRVDVVEVLVRCGDAPGDRARRDALVSLLDALDEPLGAAWAARVCAVVAEGDDADRRFDRSMATHARVRDPFEEGRTELLRGVHHRRTRRRAEARRHLARAEALFDQVGARPWRDRAATELLMLSLRTVETHLSRVDRRLGLRGRAGLAGALSSPTTPC